MGWQRAQAFCSRYALLWVLLLSTPALFPLLQPGGIVTHDGGLHLWRLWELDRLWRWGYFYPRWAPDFVFGYGYPVFQYYAPLTYYLGELFHLLGAGFYLSLKLVQALGLLSAAAAMYLFASEFYARTAQPRLAALLAALSYIYLPYLLVDLYERGTIAESFAFLFPPLILWSFARMARARGLRYLALSALSMAGLILTHNIAALIFLPFCLLYGALLAISRSGPREGAPWSIWGLALDRRLLLAEATALLLALALSAFFWLPAIGESAYAQMERGISQTLDFHTRFLGLRQLVQGSWFFRYHAAREYQVGLAQALAAGLAALFLLKGRHLSPKEKALVLGLILLSAFFITPYSLPLWENLPLMIYAQFPWRFLAPLGLGTALLMGALSLGKGWGTRLLAVGVVALMAISSLAGLHLERFPIEETSLRLGELMEAEYNMRLTGTTHTGEFLPRWVQVEPSLIPRLRPPEGEQTANGSPLEIQVLQSDPFFVRLRVQAPAEAPLVFNQFFFPYWRASLDGQQQRLFPSGDLGLTTLTVPPGNHEVTLRWTDTPLARAGSVASLLALALLAALLALPIRPRADARSILLLPSLIFLGLSLFSLGGGALPSRSSQSIVPFPWQPKPEIRLLGYSLDPAEVPASGVLNLTLYWQALSTPLRNEVVVIRLRSASGGEGRLWLEREKQPVNGTSPMRNWRPNQLVPDFHQLLLPQALPPGEYVLSLTLASVGSEVTLAKVGIQRVGRHEVRSVTPAFQRPSGADLGERVRLLGYNLLPPSAPRPFVTLKPGDTLKVELYWQALAIMEEDYTVFIHLLDSEERLVAQSDAQPMANQFRTAMWDKGEVVLDGHEIKLPSELPPGRYTLRAGMYDSRVRRLPVLEGGRLADTIPLGTVKVAPAKPISLPSEAQALRKELGDAITFLGFQIARADEGKKLKLSLYWQARHEMERDYTVFVHVLDEEGRILAQADSQPMQNRYPTSLWEEGEVVQDEHLLDVPSLPGGSYRLVAGMYELTTGLRLPVEGGGDRLELGEVTWYNPSR